MNTNRVREVMEGALARDTDELPRFLDESCGPDEELRREVESLLAARRRMGRYLEMPAAAALARHAEFAPGERVGGYEILSVIGRGGSGVVYEARQKSPDRRVALKTVRWRLGGNESRFLEEAQTLARLRHPGIATIYEAGVHGNVPWFAMEFIEGAHDLVRHALSLGIEARVRLLADLADAVHHGHQRGVVHRDLKPQNILVDASGLPKIIDFGIARAQGERGEITGTPPYMSPEQCGGGAPVDVRSDVYALGVILYEAVSGRLPHAVEGLPLAEAMRVVCQRPPDPLDIPSRGDLAAIAGKALRKNPEERYASAAEFAADLRRHLAHEPVLAHPPSIVYRARKFVRRHRALTVSVALVCASSIAAAVVSTREALATERALARAERRGYVAAIAAADGALRGGDVGTAKRALLDAPARLRGWEWDLLASMADMSRGGGRGPGGGGIGVRFLPGEKRVCGVSDYPYLAGGYVCIWDAESGRELLRTEPIHGFPGSCVVSGDGQWIAWCAHRNIAISDERLRFVTLPQEEPVNDLAFHPSEPALFAAIGRAVVMLSVPEGKEIARLATFDSDATRLAVHGALLASASEDGTLRIFDLPSRDLRTTISCGTGVDALALAEGRVAASTRDGAVRCFRLADGEEVFTAHRGDERARSLAFSPEGTTLACGHDDGMIDLRDAWTGARASTFIGHRGPVADLAFSRNGRTLVSSSYDNTWKLWDLPPDRHEVTLGTHRELVRDLAFRPDGRTLACASFEGSVKVYDTETHETLAGIQLLKGTVACVGFSLDGRRLYTGVNDGRICVLEESRKVAEWTAHPGGVFSVAPHPAGRWLASGGQDKAMVVWDVASRSAVLRETGMVWVWSVAFSPDGTLLASTGTDGPPAVARVRLRETGSWRVVRDLLHPADVVSVAFSPDGSLLATGARDGGVRVWEVRTGACRLTMSCVPAYVERVAFSPDGTRLAVATGRTVQIWDPATGERLLTLRTTIPGLYGLAFSPDGTRLAAGGGSSEGTNCAIRLWGRTGGGPWPPVLGED